MFMFEPRLGLDSFVIKIETKLRLSLLTLCGDSFPLMLMTNNVIKPCTEMTTESVYYMFISLNFFKSDMWFPLLDFSFGN